MSEWLYWFYCQQCFPCCVLYINHISFQDNKYSFVKVIIVAALSETLSSLAKKTPHISKKKILRNSISCPLTLAFWAGLFIKQFFHVASKLVKVCLIWEFSQDCNVKIVFCSSLELIVPCMQEKLSMRNAALLKTNTFTRIVNIS